MKNNSITKYILSAFCAVILFAACSDWTEVRSIEILPPDIERQNPELYQQYLANLREFRNSDRRPVYMWFDNSEKTPRSRAHRITSIPDSVDVLVLMHPENLVDWELREMEQIRRERGTKTIFTIHFDEIKAAFNAKVNAAPDDEPIATEFRDFAVDSLQHALSLVRRYNFDGISMGYSGRSLNFMTPAERLDFIQNERLFVGIMQDWIARNPNKHIVFQGTPQYLIDKSLLEHAEMIFLQGHGARSQSEMTLMLRMASVEGVPANRLGMIVSATALDDPNNVIGFFQNGNLAMYELAIWAQSPDVAGVGVFNGSTDYFSEPRAYHFVRNLISSINPPFR